MDTATEQPRPETWEGQPPRGAQAAPGLLYLTGEEFLRASAMANVANVTVRVTGRVLTPDNVIHRYDFNLTPGATRTLTSDVRGLSSGWLLDLTMRASAGAPTFGSVWGVFEIGLNGSANFVPMQTLREGFFTTNTPLSCASAVSMLPLDGPGCLRSISGATPGAGAEISETVPTNARWEPLSFRALLTASATVANRFPQLILDDGVNELQRVAVNAAITASQAVPITWAAGFPTATQQAGFIEPLPVNGRVGAGYRLRTTTVALQAGDQYSGVQYLMREWMTGE